MQVVIPSTKAQINTTEESNRLINDNHLLMMRPQEDTGGRVLRMSQHLYIWVAVVLREYVLGPRAQQRYGERDLFEEHYIDLDALGGLLEQDLVEPILQVLAGPLEKQLRTQPPVGDEDLLASAVQRQHDVLHVRGRVHVPARQLPGTHGRERAVGQVVGVVEHAARCAHHVHDPVVPLFLLVRVLALEHERALQVLDDDGVVGTRADLHLAVEERVEKHGETDRVVVIRRRVHQVRVLEHEPALVVEDLHLICA